MRNHSVQYSYEPDQGWQKPRRQWPWVYETWADLKMETWTKIKIEGKGRSAKLFVNGSEQPSLVVDGLKGSGLDAKDISTVGLNLVPLMSEQRDPKSNQVVKYAVTGFRASNVLRVRVREIDRAGDAKFLPRFLLPLGEFAACLGEAAEIENGLAAVDQTLERCKARQEEWYVPELLRIKGELMLKHSPTRAASSAEQNFSDALQLARQQGALFWELRNAMGLARLWVAQDKKAEARQIVTNAYKAFGDGHQFADARNARALLDGLGAK